MGSVPADPHRPRDSSILSPMFWFALFLLLGDPGSRPAPYCLPQAQAAIGGIRLDTPVDSVLARLGRPMSRRTRVAADDGGDYTTVELIYAHLRVDLGRDSQVERMVTTSAGTATPAGIRIGQTLTEVAQRLGISSWMDEFEEVTWTPPLCEDGPINTDAASLEVTFTWAPIPGPFDPKRPLEQERKLVKLEMSHYGP